MRFWKRSRHSVLAVLGLLLGAPSAEAQALPPDRQILDGFAKVVFGAEIRGAFSDDSYVKKFVGPIRFGIENTAAASRERAVRAFVRQLRRAVPSLDAAMATRGETPNFIVHVVDEADYQRVGRQVYRNPFMTVPGNCIVRAAYGRRGITHSDAIIVSDGGERLFQRCLIEEILQGLGPLNDNSDAPQSVFNDTSRLTSLTPYDRLLITMLYDKRLEPGMSAKTAEPLLPAILKDAKRRTRR